MSLYEIVYNETIVNNKKIYYISRFIPMKFKGLCDELEILHFEAAQIGELRVFVEIWKVEE